MNRDGQHAVDESALRYLLREKTAALTQADALGVIRNLGTQIGVDWKTAKFTVQQFAKGIAVELEHGSKDKETDVTHDDPKNTARIAWAHLKELPDYYSRLAKMESD